MWAVCLGLLASLCAGEVCLQQRARTQYMMPSTTASSAVKKVHLAVLWAPGSKKAASSPPDVRAGGSALSALHRRRLGRPLRPLERVLEAGTPAVRGSQGVACAASGGGVRQCC